jgi:7,8-dihydro-6-hydroxymethylpterin-pyrophosphokinase
MDLDLLLYGDTVICEEDLAVPHPRLAVRRFVLQPLHDIAPTLVHPQLDRSVAELLMELRSDETMTRI